MRKDVIIRNIERLVYSAPGSDREPLEPMSAWKWNRLWQIAKEHGIGAWIADGLRHYEGDFFLNIPDEVRAKINALPADKEPELLDRFQLEVDRKLSLKRRLSSHSLKTYANDFLNTIRNIEE